MLGPDQRAAQRILPNKPETRYAGVAVYTDRDQLQKTPGELVVFPIESTARGATGSLQY